MQLDALLRAHGFMRVERPPELWEADADEARFIPLLGEMIAASLSRGGRLEALILNASNVSVVDAGTPPRLVNLPNERALADPGGGAPAAGGARCA